jgi:hypothetical protein
MLEVERERVQRQEVYNEVAGDGFARFLKDIKLTRTPLQIP